MDTEKTEGEIDTTNNQEEGGGESDNISISKVEHDKLQQTLGSLKRELKDLKKVKEETKETSEKTKPDENRLLEKIERMSLRQAGLDHADDIELARSTAKKWNMDIDDVLVDADFKAKLERQQTTRANTVATSGIKGSGGKSEAKNDPAYWVAKGTPPSPTEVTDRKVRAKIIKAFIAKNKGVGENPYYNG